MLWKRGETCCFLHSLIHPFAWRLLIRLFRRAKGQDTMSKLARQGTNDACASKGGSGSSQTRVPIAQFLENNGFVPARADRESQVSDAFIPRPSNSHMDRPSSALIPGSGSAESGLTRTNSSHFQSILSPGNSDIKVSDTVTPFANMTAERMDLDVNITALRHEVSSLRNMCQNVLSSSSHLRNYELHHTSADPALDMRDPPDLIGRLAYLEGAVHSIQSVSVPAMVGRLAALEGDVEEMKTGMGVQVARMREAFGRLREALGCVDAFQ